MFHDRSIAEVCRTLAEGYPSTDEVRALLRANDEAIVLAAVLHLDRRLREGDWLDGWTRMLPADVFAMPPESQQVLAALSIDGFALNLPHAPETLSPFLRLSWLRAELLTRPDSLRSCEATPLGWEAVTNLPCERVVESGLLEQLLESTSANVRETAVSYLRTALERGYLDRTRAHEYAIQLAHDENAAIVKAALRLLREPWTFAIPLPPLRLPFGVDVDVSRELVQLFAERHDLHSLRRLLAESPLPALVPDLLTALGRTGAASDISLIVELIQQEPYSCGRPGLEALVALKRRGASPSDDDLRALLELFQVQTSLDARALAEVMSSRADRVVDALSAVSSEERDWSAIVALLESFATRRAIERLRQIIAREEERAGWWYAIRALGRLGIAEAEAEILTRLDDEPESCLDALHAIGGEETVRVLGERVSNDPAPVWLRPAATLLFQLHPSRSLFEHLARRGLLTSEILDAVPGYDTLAQSQAMSAIVTRHGTPLRLAAIRALGRTGGPLAVDLLGTVIADPDDEVRAAALAALRDLGPRLQRQRAARPACLEAAPDPAGTIVADAILRRLRERSLEPDMLARLLDSLIGLEHPLLVPIVRPHLRQRAAEVRKRVIACLGSAGPAASAWLLPWLSDDDVTVARQAILALTQVRASGLSEPLAHWLDGRNMNMKKAAAEALAVIGDRTAVPKLLHWLSVHDNPGFRELLLSALRAILGSWFVSAIIDRLSTEHDPRTHELLIEALGGQLSAVDVASIVSIRTPPSRNRDQAWTTLLLRRVYDGKCALSAGTTADLDRELAQRGLAARIPEEPQEAGKSDISSSNAVRSGVRIRQALRELAFGKPASAELNALLAKANVHGQVLVPRLSRTEVSALLDSWSQLSEAGKAGALQVLATANLDAVAKLRTARLLRSPVKVPPTLMRCFMGSTTSGFARQVLEWPDREVQAAAKKALLLDDTLEVEQWHGGDAALLLTQLIRKGAVDLCWEWSRRKGQLPELIRTLSRVQGTTFTLARIRHWLDADPALLQQMLPELLRLGPAADLELERLARSPVLELRVREQIVAELGRRTPDAWLRALLLELLSDEHAALRERAAQDLLTIADKGDRVKIIEAFLAGAFREQFSIQLNHADLPLVERAVRSAEGPERLRVIRLLEGAQDPMKIPLLIQLWKTSDHEAKAACRDALRAIDATSLLPFIQADIDSGKESILDVLGPLHSIPRRLVDQCARTSDPKTWQLFLERMSGEGPIHAPGLAEVLAHRFRAKERDRAAVRLFVRLDDWALDAKIEELAAAIAPALTTDDRAELLHCVVEATAQIGAQLRVRVLSSIARTSDESVVSSLMDSVLDNPMLRAALPSAMLVAVERRMSDALTGEAERARKVLNYRAARAKTETEQRDLIEVLEGSLRHDSARVRLHAHRLLRSHADRSRYLAATRFLLADPDPTTIRSAIRVLAFGRAVDAIPEMTELLFHSHSSVRSAAKQGLLRLGEDATSALARAIGRARPDRRPALTEILDEIERGTRSDDDEEPELSEREDSEAPIRPGTRTC